jgi:hypothetical protein
MDERILDREIKESLIRATDGLMPMKEEIWKNIQSKIESDTRPRSVRSMRRRKKARRRHILSSISLTAAAIIMVLAIGTNAGRAAVARIRDILLPEKDIVQEIEGEKEDTKVSLHEGSDSDYIIYIDESNYKMVKQDGKDRIVPKVEIGPEYPEVYLEIQHVKDKSPVDVAREVEDDLKSSFENVENYGVVEEPIKSIYLHARDGFKHNDPVVSYYIVDDNQGGAFVIKQHLFLEAAEGHGVRFYHMLKEFKVIKSQE